MISVLGASGPNRETITTGRVFAAKPRSASQISSGRGFAQDVRNVLLAGTGTGVDMSGEAVPRGNVSGIRTFLGPVPGRLPIGRRLPTCPTWFQRPGPAMLPQ